MSRRADRKRDTTKVRSYAEGGIDDKSQFNERSDRPVITKFMTQDEIHKQQLALCESYDCEVENMKWVFEPITNEYGFDEDNIDCVMLAYYWSFPDADGELKTRRVFNMKVPLPEHIKKRAQEEKQRRAQLASGEPAASTEIVPRRPRTRGQPAAT